MTVRTIGAFALLGLLSAGCAAQEHSSSAELQAVVKPPISAAKPAPPRSTVEPPIIPLVEERVTMEPAPLPQTTGESVIGGRSGGKGQPAGGAGLFMDIPFNFDQAKLRTDALAMLEINADRLQKSNGWSLLLEGHCDEIGTTDYNLVLGERRVHAVKEYLVRLGLPSSAIDGISYGKERPVCGEHTSECWQKNRVVHFDVQ